VKPVLFVTGHAPAYRVGAFERLHAREDIELALFGGSARHAGEAHAGELPLPHRRVRPHELFAIASSGDYRAVVCPTGGRVAPLASWAGARRARVPLILWTSLWAHPRTAAHALTYLPLRRLYRSANAVVTYGPHVSAYVDARGARNVHVAPQSVDNDFWSAPAPAAPTLTRWPASAESRFLFVGRPAREKGLGVLLRAWEEARLGSANTALVLVGVGAELPRDARRGAAAGDQGVVCLDPVDAVELRSLYAASDALVLPSIPTRAFREPWGLVVNEAMNQRLPVIASDAVGAAAGGLVRDEANGLVVPASEPLALANAMRRLAADPQLRARLGARGAADVRAYSHDAWAEGFARALRTVGVARGRW
jgi:glycosyltransferase involved in cell wall biosynthesis